MTQKPKHHEFQTSVQVRGDLLVSHAGQLHRGEETPKPVRLGNVVSRVPCYLAGEDSNDNLPLRTSKPHLLRCMHSHYCQNYQGIRRWFVATVSLSGCAQLSHMLITTVLCRPELLVPLYIERLISLHVSHFCFLIYELLQLPGFLGITNCSYVCTFGL